MARSTWSCLTAGIIAFYLSTPAIAVIRHVDDDAPGDPAPNNPSISDPLEDGSAAHPYDRVQEAIAAATAGDVVLVESGLYRENLNLLGKAISLRSALGPAVTTIDGNGFRIILCANGETRATVIEGFTLRGGVASGGAGGVDCQDSSPTIRGNVLVNNHGGVGGAISALANSNPLIVDNIIEDNIGNAGGAGLYCSDSAATLQGNRFARNISELEVGGAVHALRSQLTVTDNEFVENLGLGGAALHVFDCTFVDVRRNRFIRNNGVSEFAGFPGAVTWYNSVGTLADNVFFANKGDLGGAVLVSDSSPVWRNNTVVGTLSSGGSGVSTVYAFGATAFTIRSSIFWDNGASSPVDGAAAGNVQLAFCDVQGGATGIGNFNADPRFVDPASGDLHLLSNSPCRNTGDPGLVPAADDADVDGQPRIVAGCVDIGADEFVLLGDLNLDGQVTILDVPIFADVLTGKEFDPRLSRLADLNGDGVIDGADIAPFLDVIGV